MRNYEKEIEAQRNYKLYGVIRKPQEPLPYPWRAIPLIAPS